MRDQKVATQPRVFMGGPRPPMFGSGEKPKDRRNAILRLWGYLKYQKIGLLEVIVIVYSIQASDCWVPI